MSDDDDDDDDDDYDDEETEVSSFPRHKCNIGDASERFSEPPVPGILTGVPTDINSVTLSSPPARWGLLGLQHSLQLLRLCLRFYSPPPDLSCKRPIPVGTAGPQLQAPDRSEHQLQGTKRQIECQNYVTESAR